MAVVGKPHRESVREDLHRRVGSTGDPPPLTITRIGEDCHIETGTLIFAGASIGDAVICCEGCTVYPSASVGHGTKLQYRASIHERVVIGAGCRIGGFVCNDTIVGERSSIYGEIVHRYPEFGIGPDGESPWIGNDVTVGFGAVVIGSVRVGDGSYIAAGAIVTRDVEPKCVVVRVNESVPLDRWAGRLPNAGSLE